MKWISPLAWRSRAPLLVRRRSYSDRFLRWCEVGGSQAVSLRLGGGARAMTLRWNVLGWLGLWLMNAKPVTHLPRFRTVPICLGNFFSTCTCGYREWAYLDRVETRTCTDSLGHQSPGMASPWFLCRSGSLGLNVTTKQPTSCLKEDTPSRTCNMLAAQPGRRSR